MMIYIHVMERILTKEVLGQMGLSKRMRGLAVERMLAFCTERSFCI